ncbi:MAG: phosphotransferase [candidate division Zixibacteria bacterium]|nr:phosphotransferase [candidate division Zixibacteria bacterium]
MDKRSEKIFADNTEYILKEAADRYGTAPDELRRLGSFESIVCEFEREGKAYIMKVTHSLHRTPELIQGELEWVNHLADGGVSVSRAVLSGRGRLVEKIEVGDSYFLVYVFEKALGHLAQSDRWNDDLFEKWGAVLGRMHARTRSFTPSREEYRRFLWHEDYTMDIERYIPPSEPKVLEKCRTLKDKLHTLPVAKDYFGLVHCDVHHGNFFVNDGNITVFDFDDCQYHWFAFDIAIPLFYVLRDSRVNPDDTAFADNFMSLFLKGYKKENPVDRFWLERIPLFLKIREMELYFLIVSDRPENLNGWCNRFMEGRRERIEKEIPVIDIDFSRYA